jgi:hypothetical protein
LFQFVYLIKTEKIKVIHFETQFNYMKKTFDENVSKRKLYNKRNSYTSAPKVYEVDK